MPASVQSLTLSLMAVVVTKVAYEMDPSANISSEMATMRRIES